MTQATTAGVPTEIPAAIRGTKARLRARIGDVGAVLAEVEDAMRAEVDAVVATRAAGGEVWPVVRFDDIRAGTVPAATVEAVRRRGCAVVKGTFPRERAVGWDAELAAYLERNDFAGTYRHLDDGIFGGLAASKPSIFPIYWSKPQMQAREDAGMVAVRGFLNSFWKHESEGRVWFDPTRDTAYPDRVRRREPAPTPPACRRTPTPGRSSGGCCPRTSGCSGTCSTAGGTTTTRGTARTGPRWTSSRRP
jgi:hypothetical protein